MPTMQLTQVFIDAATCPTGKQKVDYFDTELAGLLLKVMPTGKRTYYLRYKDSHGKTKEKQLFNASVVDLKTARQQAKEKLAQLALGQDPFADQKLKRTVPTFAAFVRDSYLPYIETNKKSWKLDEAMLRLHVLPYLGKHYLDNITKRHVVDVISCHAKHSKPSSTNRLMTVIQCLFNCALAWDVPGLTTNPANKLAKRKDPYQRDRYLTHEELRALWKAIDCSQAEMLPYIVRMLIFTGARKNEVAHAQWTDIDWYTKQWRIPKNKSGKVRFVPLSDAAINLLCELKPKSKSAYIFANPKTQKPYVNFYHSWNTARKEAGITNIRIHDLRHTYASYLVNIGIPIYEVKEILGHANIATTQRYAHLSHATLLEATNQLAGHVNNSLRGTLESGTIITDNMIEIRAA
ncbi:tyrosine-type recombinase/integrase [Vreelandella andesensis]|nr:site-specific integrase [Halomonas andesensis]